MNIEIRKKLQKIKGGYRRISSYVRFVKNEIKIYCKIYADEKTTIRKRLALGAHALEKGAGIRNSRVGYGKEKANGLLGRIYEYLEMHGDVSAWEFREAVSVLQFYIQMSQNNGANVELISKQFEALKHKYHEVEGILKDPLAAGYVQFQQKDLVIDKDDTKKYQELMARRHSIRFYKKKAISRETILQVLEIAQTAPSACNRQPSRVYYSLDKEKNSIIDEYVPGNQAFKKEIPYYLVVTADRLAFEDNELFQWYVNGGIYVGYLTMALHMCGLGSVVFQWPNACQYEKELRSVVPIPANETIVALVGYGIIDDEVRCICAARRNCDDAVHEF